MKRLIKTITALVISLVILFIGFAVGSQLGERFIEIGRSAQAKLFSTSFKQIDFSDIAKLLLQKNAFQLFTSYANAIGEEIVDLKSIPTKDAEIFLLLLDCLPEDIEIKKLEKDDPFITMSVSSLDPKRVQEFVDNMQQKDLFLSVTCYEDQKILNTYHIRLLYNTTS